MLLVVMIFTLTSCLAKNSNEIIILNLTFDKINEIKIHTFSHGMTIEPSDEWSEFVNTMVGLKYQSISKDEVEDTFEKIKDYFRITLVLDEGYQIFFVYENNLITYYLKNINENLDDVELLTISHDDVGILFSELKEIDFPLNSILIKKPVIYLYPEEATQIDVSINSECTVTTSYPMYKDGWNVLVEPTGVITDDRGKKYSYLYWEGEIIYEDKFENGFIVKNESTITFLEEKLEKLGLNFEERNDFITYWLPELEENKYNKIRFLTEEYEEMVKLDIRPEPETVIRVFMIYKGLENDEHIEEQVIEYIQRTGYTVVEWGGAEIK